MKIRTVIVFLALALSVAPARADWRDATIPGADFSVPVTIGTFTYSLPPDSVITNLTLYSPLYSFPAGTDLFALEFAFDGIAASSLPIWPPTTEIFLGSDMTSMVPFVTWDGSLDLSIRCWLGTPPSTFTLVAGDYWILRIDFEPPANPLNDATEFVKQQYRDFLDREADSGGLQFWVNMIESGTMTRAQVIESFFWSEEFQLKLPSIVRLYFAYFLRIPDYSGLMFWIDAYKGGWSLETISDCFAASEEFQQRYGSLSNGEFVNLVYENVLARAPDIGGYFYWVIELILERRTRGQVMVGFSESDEYKSTSSHEVFVTMMYVGMLRKSPEQDGFDFWVNHLDSGGSGLVLIDEILNSQEYANRFQ